MRARKNLQVTLLVLVACSLGAWLLRPRAFSIGGIHLDESRDQVLRRYPNARSVRGMQMGGGESRVCRGFDHFTRCLELEPDLVVALDSSNRVEAVEGSQLELNGAPILRPEDRSESVERILGKPIYAGSSDADYSSYEEATTRSGEGPTLYALKRRSPPGVHAQDCRIEP